MSFKSLIPILLIANFASAWEGSVYLGSDINGNFDCKVQILKSEPTSVEVLFSALRKTDKILINIERLVLDAVDRRSLLNIDFEQRMSVPTYYSQTLRVEVSRVTNVSLLERSPGIPKKIRFESYLIYNPIQITTQVGSAPQFGGFESLTIYSCPLLYLQPSSP